MGKIRTVIRKVRKTKPIEFSTNLKIGDRVLVLTGGNKKKGKLLKGKIGRILRFLPKKNRAVVEGLNIVKDLKRAQGPNETTEVITKEGSIHISNLMYYSDVLNKPVRIKHKVLDDGRKVRGFTNPTTKTFEQIDA